MIHYYSLFIIHYSLFIIHARRPAFPRPLRPGDRPWRLRALPRRAARRLRHLPRRPRRARRPRARLLRRAACVLRGVKRRRAALAGQAAAPRRPRAHRDSTRGSARGIFRDLTRNCNRPPGQVRPALRRERRAVVRRHACCRQAIGGRGNDCNPSMPLLPITHSRWQGHVRRRLPAEARGAQRPYCAFGVVSEEF
ncbi:hypothetical protein T492DRAFT_123612 [Pavlovales sp. CCMP2436]|nr:hypothetical protein T492DRAFT_123612 [Pavlovales sp. CCMP2436]